MPTYTGIEDVEVDLGETIAEVDQPRVRSLIERVEAQIAQRVPLALNLSQGLTTLVLVRQVVAEVVAAKLRNPEGYTQSSRSVTRGPFSESISGTRGGAAAPSMTLTRRHLQLLGGLRGAGTVPLDDPALRRPVRGLGTGIGELGEGVPEGVPFGCLWPEQRA